MLSNFGTILLSKLSRRVSQSDWLILVHRTRILARIQVLLKMVSKQTIDMELVGQVPLTIHVLPMPIPPNNYYYPDIEHTYVQPAFDLNK